MQLLFEGKTFRPGLPFLTAMAPELEDGRWLKTFSESEDEAEDTDNESEADESGSECAADGDSDGDSGSECETETAGVAEEPRPRSPFYSMSQLQEIAGDIEGGHRYDSEVYLNATDAEIEQYHDAKRAAYEAFDEGYAASNAH